MKREFVWEPTLFHLFNCKTCPVQLSVDIGLKTEGIDAKAVAEILSNSHVAREKCIDVQISGTY